MSAAAPHVAPVAGAVARRWQILVVLIVSEFVVELDTTIVNVALPSMQERFGASTSELQWVVDAYTLVFAALLLLAGSLGDRLGRRRLLLGGLAIFAVGSALAATAGGASELIWSRALTGVGAAMILPATLAILTDVFPEGERARAFSIWSAATGLSFAVGPTAGGFLTDTWGWSAIFWINVPILAVAAAAAVTLIPESRDPAPRRPDALGAVLSVGGLGALLYAIIEAPRDGWDATPILVAFGVAGALLACFWRWESRTSAPMLDVRLLRNARFSVSSLSLALAFLAVAGALFVLTQYLQSVRGESALSAGVQLLPVALAIGVGAPASVPLSRRLGARAVVSAGLALAAGALLLMTAVSATSPYLLLLAGLLMGGFGLGLAITPAMEAVLNSVASARAGVGAALNTTSLTVGMALGVAILGSVLSSGYAGRIDEATQALPAPAREVARDSVGGALTVAAAQPPEAGAALAAQAREAFVGGAHVALLVGAIVAALGALVALLYLRDAPPRAPPDRGDPAA